MILPSGMQLLRNRIEGMIGVGKRGYQEVMRRGRRTRVNGQMDDEWPYWRRDGGGGCYGNRLKDTVNDEW